MKRRIEITFGTESGPETLTIDLTNPHSPSSMFLCAFFEQGIRNTTAAESIETKYRILLTRTFDVPDESTSTEGTTMQLAEYQCPCCKARLGTDEYQVTDTTSKKTLVKNRLVTTDCSHCGDRFVITYDSTDGQVWNFQALIKTTNRKIKAA